MVMKLNQIPYNKNRLTLTISSFIYFTYDSATAITLAAGDTIPVPNSTVSNKCVSCDGKNITINNSGLYQIVANFTFAATAEGPIETQMYRNGNALPAAHAIDTGAAASNLVSQAFSALVTVPCNAPQATINVKALSATSVRIANIIVVKIA